VSRALARSTAFVVAVVLTAAFSSAQTALPGPLRMRIGITDPAQQGTAQYWQALTSLHARVARVWVTWPAVAPHRPRNGRSPTDPAYQWTALDHTMTLAAAWAKATGGEVMVTVWKTPTWARRYRYVACFAFRHHRCVSPNPAGAAYAAPLPAAYADFVVALARRYNGLSAAANPASAFPRIAAVEVWNEPNASYLWAGLRTANWAGEYVEVLNATYRAVHRLPAPYPQVVGGAIGAYLGVNHVTWLETMISDHALLDGISVHPYTSFPKWGVRDGMPGYRSRLAAFPYFRVGNFSQFVRIVDGHWGRHLPIWVTEIAIQANPPNVFLGVSRNAQIAYLNQSVTILRRYPQVVAYVWYLLRDETNTRGWQSGLETSSGSIRRGLYHAFAQLAAGA
jgi:hypothetical protein